jgi:hypothetical protein
LQVLSIHPDADLREEVVERMKGQYHNLSVEMRYNIVAAYIREGQLERARDEMKKLKEQGVPVPEWLNTILLHTLGLRGDFDAVIRELYTIYDEQAELPRPLLLWLLQQASATGDYWVCDWLWNKNVVPMYITPDGETCVNILNTCAKEGEHTLAESVHGVLEVLEPEMAEKHVYLVHVAYERAGVTRDTTKQKGPNMFALFSKESGDDEAYFDPKLALRRQPLARFVNPRRLTKSTAKKEHLKALREARDTRTQYPSFDQQPPD